MSVADSRRLCFEITADKRPAAAVFVNHGDDQVVFALKIIVEGLFLKARLIQQTIEPHGYESLAMEEFMTALDEFFASRQFWHGMVPDKVYCEKSGIDHESTELDFK